MVTHRIKRTFPGPYVMYMGQLVDAGSWPNRALLEKQGYIEPLEEAQVQTQTTIAEVTSMNVESVPEVITPNVTASGSSSPTAAARTKRRRSQ